MLPPPNMAKFRPRESTLHLLHRIVNLILTALAATLPLRAGNQTESAELRSVPNIVLILADDLGYGDLGCYGQQVIQTPNIDRMAAEGLRFTDHYAGHTVCRPSRLVLWLGQHVGHTGLAGNRPRSLTSHEQTVARCLHEAGYATGGVGKWALGNVDEPSQIHNPGHPNQNGFDYWFGYLNQSNAHNYYPTFLWENDRQVPLPGNVIDPDPAGRGRVASQRVSYSHDFLTAAAFNFIRREKDHPFLLHMHWTIPHANNEGGRLRGDGMEVPDYGIYADKDWPNPEKGFAAMIGRMDADVGRLLELLKELGLDDKTLVLFTSDNGPHNEGGHRHDFFNSNGDLKGFKRSMHDGGYRVPLVARWPGKIKPATVTAHVSAFQDFLPTACALAGAAPPPAIDGISYLPTLLGQEDRQQEHEYLYCASLEGATSVGVRFGNWKLVRYRSPTANNANKANKAKTKRGEPRVAGEPKPDWRLYDLARDIGEETDLAVQHPEIVARILALLERDGLLAEPR